MIQYFDLSLQLLFVLVFISFFIVVVTKLRPLRVHPKRNISTIFLKFSYLLFLALSLMTLYLMLFFNDMSSGAVFFSMRIIVALLLLGLPHAIIAFRRRIEKNPWRHNGKGDGEAAEPDYTEH